jgi:acetyl-CoA acetyltransferase
MPDALIYDHVRTPRGRGKVDGSLHEVTALNLASQALGAIKQRNELDPTLVDDVVMGVVDPVGEAGGDIARIAALVMPATAKASPACRSTAFAPPASMPSISPPRRSCRGNRTWPSAAASSR